MVPVSDFLRGYALPEKITFSSSSSPSLAHSLNSEKSNLLKDYLIQSVLFVTLSLWCLG